MRYPLLFEVADYREDPLTPEAVAQLPIELAIDDHAYCKKPGECASVIVYLARRQGTLRVAHVSHHDSGA